MADKTYKKELTCYAIELVTSDNETERHEFTLPTEAYMFACSLDNDFYYTHSEEENAEYLGIVEQLWLKDDSPIGISEYAYYVAEHWDEIKHDLDNGTYDKWKLLHDLHLSLSY